MLHEKCHFTLVVRAFEVNVTRHEVGPSATRLILQSFVNLQPWRRQTDISECVSSNDTVSAS